MAMLARHRQAFLDSLDVNLLGNQIVLEIGAGDGLLSANLAKSHSETIFLATDVRMQPRQEGNLLRFHMDAQLMNLPDGCVDLCISHNAFEHIPSLRQTWAEILRVLKPRGQVRARFAPIWSAAYGHHWYSDDGVKVTSVIPPYGHLFLSRRELAALIRRNTKLLSLEQRIAHQCLFGNGCNRLLPDDYRQIFSGARLAPFVEDYHDCSLPQGLAGRVGLSEFDLRLLGFDLSAEKVGGIVTDVRPMLTSLLQRPPRRALFPRLAGVVRTVIDLYRPF